MIRLEPTFTERIPLDTRRGRKVWDISAKRFPRRIAIRVHIGRYVLDQSTHYHRDKHVHATWISLRHLYNSRGYTLKHRVRRRIRRALWGVNA